MKRKAIIPLVLGLGIGLATVKLLVDAIRKAQAAGNTANTVHVVRARQDIRPFQAITVDMVEVIETVDSVFAPANERIETVEEVVSRVASKAIPKHTAVLKAMLAPEGTPVGIVGRIPAGYRAVSVKIDEVTGVAYQIQPGDWVDVIVVMDINSPVRGRKETIAEVILQHVQVAAIGNVTDVRQPSGSVGNVKPAKSATLLVPEEDVPKLHLAGTRGRITLAMRGDDTETTKEPPSANMGDLVAALGNMMKVEPSSADQPLAPTPPRVEPVPPHTVVIYRGSGDGQTGMAVERTTFQDKKSSSIINVTFGPPTRAAAAMGGVNNRGNLRRPSSTEDAGRSK